jgi:hypothetical protein
MGVSRPQLVAALTLAGATEYLPIKHGHLLTATKERPDLTGISDAFQWPEFPSKTWQFVAKHGISRRVKVAIIDAGFWLNGSGIHCSIVPDTSCGVSLGAVPGVSDLHRRPFNLM